MYCPNCGIDVGESKFCLECGTKIEIVKSKENNGNKLENGQNISDKNSENVKKKKDKKKLMLFLIPLVIIGIVLAIIFAPDLINKSEPAQEISFSDLYTDYKANATLADENYNLNRYVFYFMPVKLDSDGDCEGTLYDSYGNEWEASMGSYYGRDISDYWTMKFGDDAVNLQLNTLYKLEGTFSLYYDRYFYNCSACDIEIIEENPSVNLTPIEK